MMILTAKRESDWQVQFCQEGMSGSLERPHKALIRQQQQQTPVERAHWSIFSPSLLELTCPTGPIIIIDDLDASSWSPPASSLTQRLARSAFRQVVVVVGCSPLAKVMPMQAVVPPPMPWHVSYHNGQSFRMATHQVISFISLSVIDELVLRAHTHTHTLTHNNNNTISMGNKSKFVW